LHGIKAAVLWIQDEDDDIISFKEMLPARTDGHLNVRFMITRGLGHRKIYRDGDVMRQVASFL